MGLASQPFRAGLGLGFEGMPSSPLSEKKARIPTHTPVVFLLRVGPFKIL